MIGMCISECSYFGTIVSAHGAFLSERGSERKKERGREGGERN